MKWTAQNYSFISRQNIKNIFKLQREILHARDLEKRGKISRSTKEHCTVFCLLNGFYMSMTKLFLFVFKDVPNVYRDFHFLYDLQFPPLIFSGKLTFIEYKIADGRETCCEKGSLKARLHKRFLSQQLNANFVEPKLQPAAISLRF